MPPPEKYKKRNRESACCCCSHIGVGLRCPKFMLVCTFVALLAPEKNDYTACHQEKTTTYILHVVPITTHTHVRLKSIGNKKRKEQNRKSKKKKRKKQEKIKEKERRENGIRGNNEREGKKTHHNYQTL